MLSLDRCFTQNIWEAPHMELNNQKLKEGEIMEATGILLLNEFASLHHLEKNMTSLQYTDYQAAVKTVDFSSSIGVKEGKCAFVRHQGQFFLSWMLCTTNWWAANRKTLNVKYYTKSLNCFNNDLKQGQELLVETKKLFHQDIEKLHTSIINMVKCNEVGFKLRTYPLRSQC